MNKKTFRKLVVLSRTIKLKNCGFIGILHEVNFCPYDLYQENYNWISEKRGLIFLTLTRYKDDVNLKLEV